MKYGLKKRTPQKPQAPFPAVGWAWPTGGRDQLIRAAAIPDLDRAVAAFRAWAATHDFDEITFPEQRLIVAISTRLPDGVLTPGEKARLRGVERMLWSHSIVSLRAAEPALAAIERAGIPMMVFKGAVRSVLDLSNLRGRYASEIDLLVRPASFRRAVEAVLGVNWGYRGGTDKNLDTLIGVNLVHGKFAEIDIHKYAYHQVVAADAHPDALWARASQHSFLGHPVWLPSSTDRLSMAIAHGAIDGHEQSDWMVDSARLIGEGQVDWPLFLQLMAERETEAAAEIALSYLAGPLEISVPPSVLESLRSRLRYRPFRRMAYLLEGRPKREHSAISQLGRGVARGVRMVRTGLRLRQLSRSR